MQQYSIIWLFIDQEQYVCLQHVKMNSEDKKKVSGKLADEGLHLIWVGI